MYSQLPCYSFQPLIWQLCMYMYLHVCMYACVCVLRLILYSIIFIRRCALSSPLSAFSTAAYGARSLCGMAASLKGIDVSLKNYLYKNRLPDIYEVIIKRWCNSLHAFFNFILVATYFVFKSDFFQCQQHLFKSGACCSTLDIITHYFYLRLFWPDWLYTALPTLSSTW